MREWAADGRKWARGVVALIDHLEAQSVLDYGCGKGTLGKAINDIRWQDYDPEFRPGVPMPADLVVCTHVLEHVGSPCETIEEIHRLANRAVFVSVGVGPGLSDYPNRNNFPVERWADLFRHRFSRVREIDRYAFQKGMIRNGRSATYYTAIAYP